MNNNPISAIMQIMSQAQWNPQQFANSILQNNPQFAKALQGHLTSSIFGTLLDIWDCENEIVDCFWIVD